MSKIQDIILKLNKLRDLHERGVEIMKEEVPVGPTGNLRDSIHYEHTGEDAWVIIADPVSKDGFHYARAVNDGRTAVFAQNARWLQWEGYAGSQTTIHSPDPGKYYRSESVNGARANNFRARTLGRLVQEKNKIFP